MGLLVDGEWHDAWYDTKATGGRFVRKESSFRAWVTPDGSPGTTGAGGHRAEADRYHLYVSLACPWAHRTLIMRALKGLTEVVSVSVVNWLMLDRGWTFDPGSGVVADPVMGAEALYELYVAADPTYTGRVTVPVLWDKALGTIVSNESAEILRMLNSAFQGLGADGTDYYPAACRPEIDEVNARIYDTLSNGVYKAGFATGQSAYEEAVAPLFETLDWLENRLRARRWLVGDALTEADIRLFTTLIRFDAVYVGHFKTNLKRIADYPALSGFVREVYQLPGIADTVDFRHIKGHYYQSHPTINPTGIVPMGPMLDLDLPHGRGHLA